jgi:hypothetical protein
MRNPKHPNREKVRIDFSKSALNAASNKARQEGKSLSAYVEDLVIQDLGPLPKTMSGAP